MAPAAHHSANDVKQGKTFIGPNLTRRGVFASAGTVIALAAIGTRLEAVSGRRHPVVSLNADEPYLDLTGTDVPYRPRVASDWAASLDDEALMRLGHYL